LQLLPLPSGRMAALSSSVKAAVGAQLLKTVEKISLQQLTVGEELGKGKFKRVNRGSHKRRGVAIVRYTRDESNDNELRVLSALSKPPGTAVPEIYGVCSERDALVVVQELAPFGSLKKVIQNTESAAKATPMHRLTCSQQIAAAMVFLESRHVVHADLSCRNVLVFHLDASAPQVTVVKVTDFSLSLALPDDKTFEIRKQPQATRWCAPETTAHMKLSHKSDVWSFGALCWELFAGGSTPWLSRENRADVATRLRDLAETGGEAEGGADVSGDFPQQEGCPLPMHELILCCFTVDEAVRPDFKQLVDNFEGIVEEITSGVVSCRASNTRQVAALGTNATTSEEEKPEPEVPAVTPVVGEEQEEVEEGPVLTLTETRDVNLPKVRSRPRRPDLPPPTLELSIDDTSELNVVDANFKVMRALLSSSSAVEVLGEETMIALAQDLDAVHAREAYLHDLVQKLREGRSVSRSSTPGRRLSSPRVSLRPRPMSATSSSHRLSTTCPTDEALTEDSPGSQGALPSSPVPEVSSVQCPAIASISPPWSLWSHAHDTLQRQDFQLEGDAWAAFHNTAWPCILRAPSGAEVAARQWTTSYCQVVFAAGTPAVGSFALSPPSACGGSFACVVGRSTPR